jgi:hypothetical protein
MPFIITLAKGDIAISMKTRTLFRATLSFLFFSVSCPGAFEPTLELDIHALPIPRLPKRSLTSLR